MAGTLQRTLMLFALMACSSAAFAQSGRTWVDPPAQDGAQPQASTPPATPDTGPTNAADPKPAAASSSQAPGAANEQAGQSNENLHPQTPSGDAPAKPAVKNQTSRKAVAERRSRAPTGQAAASSRTSPRNGMIASRREPSAGRRIAVTRREGRSAAGPRGTRFGRAQGAPGSRLEVMNLRTIQFPDGRRVTILTRPNPDAMSELTRPPGY
jgi:hypothetical protein